MNKHVIQNIVVIACHHVVTKFDPLIEVSVVLFGRDALSRIQTFHIQAYLITFSVADDQLAWCVGLAPVLTVRCLVNEENIAEHLENRLAITGLAVESLVKIRLARLVLELDELAGL